MIKLITPFVFMFCIAFCVAQTTTDEYYTPSKPKLSLQDRVTTSIEMGAGVSIFNKTNTALTTYVAPKINYQLTNKFKLNVGLMHYSMTGNTFMPLNYHEGLINTSNNPITGNMIFVGGEYQLNNKMIFSGAVMADVNSLSKNQINSKAVQLGMEYKVSEHSSVKITTTISQGQGSIYNGFNSFDRANPYYYGNGNNDMFRSPTVGGIESLGVQSLNRAIR